jgi:A nuclease of the HNH/ENDO VII superfamily with conserved WHH
MDFAEQERKPKQTIAPTHQSPSAEGSEETPLPPGNGVDYSKAYKFKQNKLLFGDIPPHLRRDISTSSDSGSAQIPASGRSPYPPTTPGNGVDYSKAYKFNQNKTLFGDIPPHLQTQGKAQGQSNAAVPQQSQQPEPKTAQPESMQLASAKLDPEQSQSGLPSQGVKVASTGQMRLDPGETDSKSVPVRKSTPASLTPEQALHRKFETDVAAHAQGLLKANKDRLNSEQTQYAQDKNPNSDRWQKLWQAADQRREFQRKQATAQTNYDYANHQIEALMASPNDFNPMAPAEQRRKDAQQKANLIADYKNLRAVSRTQIEQARQNQTTLTYAYPALAAVQNESGNHPKDIQAVQSRIPGEFDGIRGNIDKLSAEMVKDPSVATLFDSVVQQSLHQVPPEQQPQVMTWLKTQRENQERNTQIGALASGGLMLASLFPVGRLTATGLRMVGIGLGGGVAAAQMPDLMLLDTAAQAGRGGTPLANQSPDQAKFNLVMGYANVGLAGLDVGLETGAVQKLAGVSGKLAMTGVQVSREKWGQVMGWVKQGPAGIEKAQAFLASVKGWSKETAAEAIQTIKDGFSNIRKRSAPEVETVGVLSGQSAVKTTEENIKDAKALQSKRSAQSSGKTTKELSSIPISATSQQIKQIRTLLKEHNIDENALALKEYLESRKDNLDTAIKSLSESLENPKPKLRNNSFAGKTFDVEELKKWESKYPGISRKYPEGVKFTKDGYPDFSPYTVKGGSVKIEMQGNYTSDFEQATNLARKNGVSEEVLAKIQKDYTWHHSEDMTTMFLVPSDIHDVVRHSGGISRIKALRNLSGR